MAVREAGCWYNLGFSAIGRGGNTSHEGFSPQIVMTPELPASQKLRRNSRPSPKDSQEHTRCQRTLPFVPGILSEHKAKMAAPQEPTLRAVPATMKAQQ